MSSLNNDLMLIAALKRGDKRAYEFIYLEYYESLCLYILSFTNDRARTEDIVQDTLLKFWLKREKLNVHTSIKSYLYRAVYHNYIDVCRRDQLQGKIVESIQRDTLNALLEEKNEVVEQQLAELRKAIDELPPRCREIFINCKLKGLKYREIAEKLNISVKTVENQIGKAFVMIREKMGL